MRLTLSLEFGTIYLMPFVKRVYHWLVDLAETLVIAGAIFVVIYAFLVRPFQVNGTSMDPTFKNGEFVFTNLITQRFSQLDRGDVIVFKSPPEPDKDYIKRIIGLPGDVVLIQNGKVYVNGKQLNETYLPVGRVTEAHGFAQEGQEIKVSPKTYFVMGDNRPASSDSRDWGLLPFKNVVGKSALVYWPIPSMRLVEHAEYK